MDRILNSLAQFTPQQFFFGGLIMIVLGLLFVLLYVIKFFGNHTNDTINRNSDAFVKLSESNQRLADTIDRWHSKNE